MAGGEGTRLYPFTEEISKCIVPVGGRPVMSYMIEYMRKLGIKDITIIINSKTGDRIRQMFGPRFRYIEQPLDKKGTGFAVQLAKEYITEDTLIVAGDVIVEFEDVKRLVEIHGDSNHVATMLLKEVENPQRYGTIRLENGLVREIVEKSSNPPSNLVNTSVYVVSQKFKQYIEEIPISERGEYEIIPPLRKLAYNRLLGGVIAKGYWNDIGTPWELLNANEKFMGKIKKSVKGRIVNSTVVGEVVVEEGAIVENAYIKGPVYIARNSYIGPGAQVLPYSYIGEGCSIGGGTIIKNSILLGHVNAKHLSYIGDSLIAEGCNFGSSTQLANFRFDGQTIKMNIKGKRVDTGRRKMGAVIGPRVKFGVNSSVMPGIKIGKDARIFPGTVVSRDVEDSEEYKE